MKTTILILVSFFLFSCSMPTRDWVWVVEDTKNVINDYGNTLEGSVKDVRAVRDLYNQDNEDLQKAIQDSIK